MDEPVGKGHLNDNGYHLSVNSVMEYFELAQDLTGGDLPMSAGMPHWEGMARMSPSSISALPCAWCDALVAQSDAIASIAIHDGLAQGSLHTQVAQRWQQMTKIGFGSIAHAKLATAQLKIEKAQSWLRAAIINENFLGIEVAMPASCTVQYHRGIGEQAKDGLLLCMPPACRKQAILQADVTFECMRDEYGFPRAIAVAHVEICHFRCCDAQLAQSTHGKHLA